MVQFAELTQVASNEVTRLHREWPGAKAWLEIPLDAKRE